jgi:hypothetical protein
VAISPNGESYRISVHTVEDLDGRHADLAELPSVDPVDEQYVGEGRELGHTTDEREALRFSEQMTSAVPTWRRTARRAGHHTATLGPAHRPDQLATRCRRALAGRETLKR